MSVFKQPLWSFSVSFYAWPGVEVLCLALQDDQQVNVNQLLWALWLDESHAAMNPSLWHAGLRRARLWHDYCVRPLRYVRRRLPKRGWVNVLRNWVKRWELWAEKTELQKLETHSYCTPLETTTAYTGVYIKHLLSQNDSQRQALMGLVEQWRHHQQ